MIHFTPPEELHLFGSFVFNVHSGAFCAGAAAAYIMTYFRLPKDLREHLDTISLWMTVGGILGARLLFAAVNFKDMHSFAQIFAFWQGGLISYGGFFGAILAWILYIKKNKLPMDVFCQALSPSALLGWGIGRIGCFLSWNGEIGIPADVPWAFIVGQDVPRHPVMLYLALSHIAFALLSVPISAKYRINAAAVSLFAFGAVRMILDYWRQYDPAWLYQGSIALSLVWVISALAIGKNLKYPEAAETMTKEPENEA